MEKLERILHAEEGARARVSEARSEAARIVREATERAAEVRARAEQDAAAAAAAQAGAIVQSARDSIERTQAEAAIALSEVLEQAEARFDSALAAVLSEMVD